MSFEKCLFEVNYIIENMSDELKKKIPKAIRKEIKNKMSKEAYLYAIDFTEEDFSDETRAYLSVLYVKYFCSKEEKQKWIDFDKMCRNLNKNML